MLRPFYLFWFWVFGWKTNGQFPPHLKKFIIAVGPHTSNWDFMVAVAARSILRIQKAKFLGKSQLFKPPYGWFFRAIGGYPVERNKSNDMVEQVAAIFENHDEFIIAVAPEGTRKKVERLRTGFYYIAKAARVPVIPVGLDFGKREIIVGEPLFPSDPKADMDTLIRFFANVQGKNPELGISIATEGVR